MTYGVRNPSSSLCRAQRCGGVKPVNDIIAFPFLRIGSPTPKSRYKYQISTMSTKLFSNVLLIEIKQGHIYLNVRTE
jgi:hypothetical protein